MSSREKILGSLPSASQVPAKEFPTLAPVQFDNPLDKFRDVLRSIGGAVIDMPTINGVREYMFQHFGADQRVVSSISLNHVNNGKAKTLHPYDNVEATLIRGHFGVAENGAIWITDDLLSDRVLPFICQQLLIVIDKEDIVPTLHEAYYRVALNEYEFGTFIAGPSKTADIEQSLVLGAHGPKTLTVFIVDDCRE